MGTKFPNQVMRVGTIPAGAAGLGSFGLDGTSSANAGDAVNSMLTMTISRAKTRASFTIFPLVELSKFHARYDYLTLSIIIA